MHDDNAYDDDDLFNEDGELIDTGFDDFPELDYTDDDEEENIQNDDDDFFPTSGPSTLFDEFGDEFDEESDDYELDGDGEFDDENF